MSSKPYPPEPEANCTLCPRLVAFRQENEEKFPDFFNGAVPSFGNNDAELLIIGLAPGLKGANRTGRPFTGDYAGDLLYDCLQKIGLAVGNYQKHADDGFTLVKTMITNAVRCVPPQNKPIGEEVNNCRPFLDARIAALKNLKAYLALGKIAHDTAIRNFGLKLKDYPFGHARTHHLPDGKVLIDSYHCSRYNVNTGRITEEMFLDALRLCQKAMDS